MEKEGSNIQLSVAEDIVLSVEANSNQVHVIKPCLNKFCKLSKQSQVYFSTNTNKGVRVDVYNILDISRTDVLGKYLEVLTINERTTEANFQAVI